MSASKRIKLAIEEYGPRLLLAPYMKWRYRNRHVDLAVPVAERFAEIYRTNDWGDSESRSGPGSNASAASRLMQLLPSLFAELQVQTFMDIPCGDFNWMRNVEMSACKYIGGDIVKDLIDQNNAQYASQTRSFVCVDLSKDALPPGDLLLVRDCFIHLSFDMIKMALANIKRSSIRYLLTTTYPSKRRNWDIDTGGFRPINLINPPFNLPPPVKLIQEDDLGGYRSDYDRYLGLWRTSDL